MKIYLAGTFGEKKHIKNLEQIPYLLESFYYIQDWQMPIIRKCQDFLLDSGAFTFMQNSKKKTDWNEYIERYARFIVENGIDKFFELDIDSVVGYDKVKEFRQRLEMLTGKQCIPVWHSNRGIADFKEMCTEYPYVALGGIVANEWKESAEKYMPWFIQTAHKYGAKIHGLGYTKTSKLPLYHFDSVDSTRWNCARFGRLEYFNGRTMISVDKRKQGKRLVGRTEGDTIGFTLNEWIKFQKYADTHL